jgi:hypothetical protein
MTAGYLYDIARHFAAVAGLKGTYCGAGDGPGQPVQALPTSLPDSPSLVVFDAEEGVVPGNAERWQVGAELHLYVSQAEGLGAAYERARSFKPLLLTRLQASITTTELNSLVFTTFRPIEERAWPADSERRYFVLPCVLEGRVNKSVTYVPPTRV